MRPSIFPEYVDARMTSPGFQAFVLILNCLVAHWWKGTPAIYRGVVPSSGMEGRLAIVQRGSA